MYVSGSAISAVLCMKRQAYSEVRKWSVHNNDIYKWEYKVSRVWNVTCLYPMKMIWNLKF